jgi:hypothetical protein
MAASYTFNTDEDTETRRRRRRQSIADLLMKNADAAPIQSPWQGAAKMVNAGISGFLLGREEKRDREASEARNAYGSKLSEELAGGGGASPVTAALAGKPMGGPIKLGGFEPTVARTLEFEGGLNPNDSNGTPSNFGINQKANPDVDVTKLTPQGATEIYRKRYWDAIGADKMDPRTAHVAFDTAVIAGPRKAKELLAASGGDPEKFLALREAFQNRLLAANPEKYGPYAKAWANRTATLRADVGVGGGGQPGGMMAVGGGGGDTTLAGGDTLQGRGMPDANRLMQIATDRNAPPEIRERAKLMLQSMPKPRDPLDEENRSLQNQKLRRDLETPNADLELFKDADGNVVGSFNKRTGERKLFEGQPQQNPNLFKGNSADAQALNELVRTGRLTREQAAMIAAGKFSTGPNGEILFVTPEAIFPNAAPASKPPPEVPPGTAAAQTTKPSPDMPGVRPVTPPKADKPLTESESKIFQFTRRADAADKTLKDLEYEGGRSVSRFLEKNVPGGNYLVGDNFQKFSQAKREFINALLRRESGAVIGAEEEANFDKQYMPQPGDGAAVVEQKRKARVRAVQAMKEELGGKYKEPTEQDAPAASSANPVDLMKKYGLDDGKR